MNIASILEQVSHHTDAEQAYMIRWVAVNHPGIADQALDALARHQTGQAP